jgi:hypothetical protein
LALFMNHSAHRYRQYLCALWSCVCVWRCVWVTVQTDTDSTCLHCDPVCVFGVVYGSQCRQIQTVPACTVILCVCLRCVWITVQTDTQVHRITWCHTLTTSKPMYVRSLSVALTKYWTAPWGWILYEPKHVGASVIVFFNYFIIEVLYY